MGQAQSCKQGHRGKANLFPAIANGELEVVKAMVEKDPTVLKHTTGKHKLSPLHVAAASGQLQVLSMLLDKKLNVDILNRSKETPLMLAVKNGKIDCVEKLLHVGANLLLCDSVNGETCLHYAAFHGHVNCLKAILSTAQSTGVAGYGGFARFVNVGDGNGHTPLHLAALQRKSECLHALLENGACVCARTRHCGRTPLHMAAIGGCKKCTLTLLAWGADRLQIDCFGKPPFLVAKDCNHEECAELLNPSSATPIVWPLHVNFITQLTQEVKVLLEKAFIEVNKEREKDILKKVYRSSSSPLYFNSNDGDDSNIFEVSNKELCCICCEQVKTIEMRPCGHQMCAQCTLRLCQNNHNNCSICVSPFKPVCPFCRGDILQLLVATTN
ncbi:hypothetical protein VNO78_27579 [Psophocarpus tetragonolobus]|uniref:RING-type E3 ubiquitin transferase n=1 Tax=Psophocarpus tetragonolobus TaxID=3891 RepID=A0AAN9S1A9_PSOTE